MSALSIQPTYPIFTDIDGQPLEAGYVWIGTANLDPQTNPINVYWDEALTILAPQPIRTLAGYPSRNGTPARLYVNSDYSIRVMNKNGSAVYSAPAATERYNNVVISSMNAADVIYTPDIPGAPTTNVAEALDQTVSATSFGVVGDGVTDDTVAIQNAITYLAINGGRLVFPYATYLITSQIILPFGNNATNKMFIVDFGNSVIKSNVPTPTGATFTGLISGYLSGTTPVASVTGTEAHVAANAVFMNLNLNGFGTGIRLHNFNYGCALQNVQVENCFNGIELSRCFYLILDNIPLRGMGLNVGGVGFKTTAFSNIMPMSGIKVGQFTTGMQLGGFDGGKMTDCSAEGCQIGVELFSESSVMHLDTFYLEGNTVANLKFSTVVRRCLITNTWFQGDADKHLISSMTSDMYSNVTFISTFFNGGGITTSPPINNLFGDILNYNSNPLNAPLFTGAPNLRAISARYEIDTSGFGYNGPVRSLDSREYNGLIATAYGGKFRNGVTSGDNAPYQTIVDNGGSLEFTTQFANDGFTALLWHVSIAHSVGTWSRTYLVFFDNAAGSWRLYKPDAAGLTVDTTVTCTNNGGFLMLKAPTFTGPSTNYSVVRTL